MVDVNVRTNCDICGLRRSGNNHSKCSRIRQKRFKQKGVYVLAKKTSEGVEAIGLIEQKPNKKQSVTNS